MKMFITTMALILAIGTAARADDAMKAQPMKTGAMADCMKKAEMETDSMKKKQMSDDCSHGGAMSAMKPAPKQ